ADSDFTRQKKLLESRDISQANFDQIECRLDELKAQYAAAEYALKASELGLVVLQHNLEASQEMIEQAREALSYTMITSPIDGIVTRINAEVGEVVMTGTMNNPGTIIMQVADLSQMILVAQVDEADIGNLKVGQKAAIRVQAFWDDEFTGVVDTIALTHDMSVTRTKYYKTEILLDESAKQLYSGLTADVDIETVRHKAILKVPSQAVVSRRVDDLPLEIRRDNPNVDMGKTDCLVVYRLVDGKAAVTPVSIGPGDMTHIIIKSGLNVGDKVVTGPYKVLAGVESSRGLTAGGIKHGQRIRDEKEVGKEKNKQAQADKEPNTLRKTDK
ncbi:MAG: efflux RND transporter periplasmic adaptor subunit, partial [Planctomycetes bacterium]|nr:efflux RND transporter periplasmic adaptor subunit [Planctomycetota bacterium]